MYHVLHTLPPQKQLPVLSNMSRSSFEHYNKQHIYTYIYIYIYTHPYIPKYTSSQQVAIFSWRARIVPQAGPIWWSNASRTLPFCCDEPDSTVIEVSLGRYRRYRQTTSFILRATASTASNLDTKGVFRFFLPASMLLCSNCSGIACKFKYTLD